MLKKDLSHVSQTRMVMRVEVLKPESRRVELPDRKLNANSATGSRRPASSTCRCAFKVNTKFKNTPTSPTARYPQMRVTLDISSIMIFLATENLTWKAISNPNQNKKKRFMSGVNFACNKCYNNKRLNYVIDNR